MGAAWEHGSKGASRAERVIVELGCGLLALVVRAGGAVIRLHWGRGESVDCICFFSQNRRRPRSRWCRLANGYVRQGGKTATGLR